MPHRAIVCISAYLISASKRCSTRLRWWCGAACKRLTRAARGRTIRIPDFRSTERQYDAACELREAHRLPRAEPGRQDHARPPAFSIDLPYLLREPAGPGP